MKVGPFRACRLMGVWIVALAICMGSGCGSDPTDDAPPRDRIPATAPAPLAATPPAAASQAATSQTVAPPAAASLDAANPDARLAEMRGKVFSTSPSGEPAVSVGDLFLTDDELRRIRRLGATAAIAMPHGGNDWADAQIEGLTTQFAVMGVTVAMIANAEFNSEKQERDLLRIIARGPDALVAFPLAPAALFRKAAERDIRIVFMDMPPKGEALAHGTDYVSVVSADSAGNGQVSAHLLARRLKEKGAVGVIAHQPDFFVTHQRYLAFKSILARDYPGIGILEEIIMPGPDYYEDGRRAATALIARHPEMTGLWTPWDVPAEGAMAAARAAGRTDLAIVTIDLGFDVAMAMARGEMIAGTGAQRPFDQGVTEAMLAGYGLIGKPAPPWVVLPALPVSRRNLLRAWEIIYHRPPPPELAEAVGGDGERAP